MIEIKNISKTFKNNKVLDGIDLTINQGDVVAIIGPSGTGKSTFLRCVDRLEKPETGTITIDGETQDLAHIHGKDLTELRKKTGMVFQNFNLFSKKTALQNVMEGLIVVKKMKKEEAERIAREQLKNVGLLDHANHYPRHMSGGQQQRVAIARALAWSQSFCFWMSRHLHWIRSLSEKFWIRSKKRQMKDIQCFWCPMR